MTGTAKIRVGFGAGFALLLGICLAAVLQTFQWERSAHAVARSNEVIERLEELSLQSKDAEDAARRFISAGDRLDLARCREELSRAREREVELENLVADSSVQRKTIAAVRRLISQQADTILQNVPPDINTGTASVSQALASLDSAGLSSNLRAAILEMETEERRILGEATVWQERTVALSRMLFAVASAFSLILIVIAGWRMTVDQKKRAAIEQKLSAKEEQYRRVVELAGDIICRTDEQGRFTFCNQAALTSLHFSESEVIGRSWLKLIRQDRRRRRRALLHEAVCAQTEEYLLRIAPHRRTWPWSAGSARAYNWCSRRTKSSDFRRSPAKSRSANRPRSSCRRAGTSWNGSPPLRRAFSMFTILSSAGMSTAIVRSSRSSATSLKRSGTPRNWSGGSTIPTIRRMIEGHREAMRSAQDGEVRRLEYRARHADGHWVWLSGRETPFERGADGLVKQMVGISQDITARKAAQDKLAYQANYDALTGLSNRHYFWTGSAVAVEAGEHRTFRDRVVPVRHRPFQGYQRSFRPRRRR